MRRLEKMLAAGGLCAALLVLTPLPTVAQTATAAAPATVPLASAPADAKPHRVVLQVNTNDPATMNLALNNATNVETYYRQKGERVEIEVVTFGPGLHMLRDDTSPVKDRIKAIAEKSPSISFKACGNTQENMNKAEGKPVTLVAQASVVKSGVVRLIELQEQGWTYVRP